MKFECNRCDKLVDESEAIIIFSHARVVGTSIFVYHEKCYKELKPKKL